MCTGLGYTPVVIGEPWIADRREPGVDGEHVRVRNCRETGLVELSLLEVREVERPISKDRAAHARAVLLLAHRQLGARDSAFGALKRSSRKYAVEIAP